jgi:uncharacterized protein Yka (UPF0111/DUF47 family)
VRRVAGAHVPYGTRLDAALGIEKTSDFLRQALRVASERLASGRSIRLLNDEVQALLASEFETPESALLAVLIRHLGISRMLAGLVEDALPGDRLASAQHRQNVAKQARKLEHKADKLTIEAREMSSRLSIAPAQARTMVDAVEDAVDSLEDTAFFLSLVPDRQNETFARPFRALVSIAKDGVAHLIRAVEASSCLPDGAQADVTAALLAVDAVIDAEKRADDALRIAMAASVANVSDSKFLPLEFEMTRAVERSTDHLARAAHKVLCAPRTLSGFARRVLQQAVELLNLSREPVRDDFPFAKKNLSGFTVDRNPVPFADLLFAQSCHAFLGVDGERGAADDTHLAELGGG